MSRRQVGWLRYLSRFHYVWENRKGVNNIADPLSRNPALLNLVMLESAIGPAEELKQKVRDGHAKDLSFSTLKK